MTQRIIYQNEYPYFLTSNTYYRRIFFNNTKKAQILYEVIFTKCKSLKCKIISFCTMPDHVHWFLWPNDKNNISKVMQQIKSCYVNELRVKFNLNTKVWQPRYNYRIVDNHKRLCNTLEYIKKNYLKTGLSPKYGRKPYTYFNWREIRKLF